MLVEPGTLSRRVERTGAWVGVEYVRSLTALHPDGAAATASCAGGSLAFAGPQHPMSRASGLGFAGAVTPADLDSLESFYFTRGAPALVEVSPYADASLRELLGGRRYALAELENVWHRELRPGEPLPEPAVETRLARPEEAEIWARTVLGGAFSPGEVAPLDLDVFTPFPRMRGVSCFLTFADGRPAGGGCLAVSEGTAALFTTSTVPAFRRRGVQGALLAARLRAAAEGGCDLAYAVTEPGSVSERNVRRLGFSLLYTRAVLVRAGRN